MDHNCCAGNLADMLELLHPLTRPSIVILDTIAGISEITSSTHFGPYSTTAEQGNWSNCFD